ncbi:MAG TPA: PilZ domain-containing protein [Terriglobales bacterium]|nr:PilZ domain-containing protein [Terriglobales bacterium]HXY16378.1 PilZ domain-containing protein [Terriglobales bacterium]
MANANQQERRQYPRFKISVPVEIRADGAASPVHGATLDLSLGGCYFETIFPFPVGTELDLRLQLDSAVPISAVAVTCDPQVGNGIKFTKMLPEDRKALAVFLSAVEARQRVTRFAS